MTKEQELKPSSGWSRLPIALLLIVGAPTGFVLGIVLASNDYGLVGALLIITGILSGLSGLLLHQSIFLVDQPRLGGDQIVLVVDDVQSLFHLDGKGYDQGSHEQEQRAAQPGELEL